MFKIIILRNSVLLWIIIKIKPFPPNVKTDMLPSFTFCLMHILLSRWWRLFVFITLHDQRNPVIHDSLNLITILTWELEACLAFGWQHHNTYFTIGSLSDRWLTTSRYLLQYRKLVWCLVDYITILTSLYEAFLMSGIWLTKSQYLLECRKLVWHMVDNIRICEKHYSCIRCYEYKNMPDSMQVRESHTRPVGTQESVISYN